MRENRLKAVILSLFSIVGVQDQGRTQTRERIRHKCVYSYDFREVSRNTFCGIDSTFLTNSGTASSGVRNVFPRIFYFTSGKGKTSQGLTPSCKVDAPLT